MGDRREGEAYFMSSLSYNGQWMRGKVRFKLIYLSLAAKAT